MTAMYQTQDNPVFNLIANLAGIAAAIGYVAVAASVAVVGYTLTTLPVIFRLLLAALFAAGAFAARNAKCIGLCVAVISAVVVCFAVPQVAVGVLCVLVFAEVTK